uniref:Protein SYS1 homolog n=1 Tax=Entomoneis paludosa TaxID=265537 RepID=A0A7S3DXW5_9STRA|mmetsp:Transcript_6995/g.14627  ORF Transcript_6995/g.14627 Transcript_6995/m.14627 type:complete len:252 (+) Transcript_6995:95-850(+)
MSSRSVASARSEPEQRRVNAVSSNNTLPSVSSNHHNSPKGDAESRASTRVSHASTRASAQSNNNGNINPNITNNGLNNNNNNIKNGRGVNAAVSRGASSSKMHKAEALARFHPKMITAQIISLQCFQYLAQSILIQINFLLFSIPTSVDRIFTDKYLHIWRRDGIADCIMMLMAALFGAVGLALIVEKSKKCLDFTVTYFILHLILSTMYNGFPTTFDWWIVHVLSLLVMVVLGEYLCSLKELEMIPLLQF